MKLIMVGIYCIRHRESNLCYVGKSGDIAHIRGQLRSRPMLRDAIEAHGADAFDVEVLEVCKAENCETRKDHYIAALDCRVPNGYNYRFGNRHHESTRQKISESLKGEKNPFWGKTLSADHRRKISEANRGENHPFYGKKHSAEFLERMSGENHPFYGKKHSAETIEKMREKKRHPCWENADEICQRFLRGETLISIAADMGCQSTTPIKRILKSRQITAADRY